jgi:hypothetical protein
MLTPRVVAFADVLGDSLYAFGGLNAAPLNTVERFDGAAWTAAPSMPQTLREFGHAVFKGQLFVFGGTQMSGNAGRSIFVFDGLGWTVSPFVLTQPRRGLVAAVY